ncbi:MAG: discoidin domain-containing protein [Brevundimonas sp.]
MQRTPSTTRQNRRPLALVAAGLSAALVAAGVIGSIASAASAADVNLSQGKTATASSVESADYTPAKAAVDGDNGTRWSSQASDSQWLQVDLGSSKTIGSVQLRWETAYAKAFTIQTSQDGTSWTTVATVTNGTGGNQTVAAPGTGRYVRINLTQRATGYGYSLWEFQVFGPDGTTPTATPTPTTPTGTCGTTNAALGKASSASSVQTGSDYVAANAFDGKDNTRWSSASTDAEWLQVDLGSSQNVCKVEIDWEGAYGKAYTIQASDSPTSGFTTIGTVTAGTGGKASITTSGKGRYIRLVGGTRGTGYGYSLWEMRVFTGTSSTPTPTATPTPTPTSNPTQGPGDVQPADPANPNFGPNTYVFKPTDDQAAIQNKVNEVFKRQESNQFGDERDQFLFLPGNYNLQANIGFYTSISGAGQNPDDVNINGGVWVDAQWFNGNATQNFWRSAENFAVTPSTGQDRWAVAQAAPFRRVHVKGDLALHSSAYGWASGGYIADSKVDGSVAAWTQQQWYTRDSSVGSWQGSLWNMVFSGVQGAPATSFPDPAITTLPTTGAVREKPYLYNKDGKWSVFVPNLRNGTTGTTWPNTPGTSLSLSTFYLAHPGDSGATINQALAQGLNVIFTPGVYHLNQTINVTRANTVVLGLGMATIVPENGVDGLHTADVDGIKIAGLLFDQGTTHSNTVVTIGTAGAHTSHAANPQSIQDVFIRVGGVVAGKVDNGIVVNADNTIIDHIWSWRADHGAGAGWTQNTSDYGLIVNGNNVNGYGLFVEHYQKYNLLWNGENGRVLFFQNELPYDPPSTAAWTHDGIRGWAAYKVAPGVKNHEAWGLGSYCVFTTDSTITVDNGFEVPITPGVKLHSLSTVSLGGAGTYAHVINGTGPQASGTETKPATVANYGG